MGVDIHSYAEVRRNGVWKPVLANFINHVGFPMPQKPYRDAPLSSKCTAMYGFLGGLYGPPYISKGRGLPADVSEDVKRAIEDTWLAECDFGMTWVTLGEVLAWPAWTAERICMCPELWEEVVPALLSHVTPEPQQEVMWTLLKAIRDDVDGLAVAAIADLLEESGSPGLADVRIIMWFDA